MRKMIVVLLLVTGIILGMVSVIEVSEGNVSGAYDPAYNGIESSGKSIADLPAPCDERGGSGGGTPG